MKYPTSSPAPHARTEDETNALIISRAEEMHAYVRSLWRTPEFQKSHDEGGLVFQIVEKLAALPRFFFERTDDWAETSNFTAHYGGIQLRPTDYAKDAVHDLYLLHEMTHAGTMPACPDLLYPIFVQKLLENESEASVCSEIAAYFDMPGLRAKSFDFEIYADRFLKDPAWQAEWKNRPEEFFKDMRLLRLNVMHPDYKPQDLVEKWIQLLAQQNTEGYGIAGASYNDIEKAMWKLRNDCDDPAIGRDQAAKNFMDWVRSPAVSKGTDIPFPDEAAAFAKIYWKNKAAYKKEVEHTDAVKPPPAGPAPQP